MTKRTKAVGLRPSPDIITTISRYPKLSPEREAELILKAQDGDYKAREIVICSNLYWICSVGGRFTRSSGIDDVELISEGYFGLNRAIDQWNPKKGGNIRTFSQRKIYKFQSEGIRKRNHIRLPKSTYEQLSSLKKATASLGEDASIAQLSGKTKIREKRIEQLQAISQPTSLNVIAGKSEDLELLDWQVDESQEKLDPAISSELLDLVEKLHPRQREVLHLHYWEEMSFLKISEFLGKPQKQVRKIYKQAIGLLRKFFEGEISEFPALPLLQWNNFVFAKIFLTTGLSKIFNAVVTQLQRLKRLHQNNHTTQTAPHQPELPVSQNSTEVLLGDDRAWTVRNQAEYSTPHSAWYQRLWCFLNVAKTPFPNATKHRIDSGGLRDGPRYLVYYFWHSISCVVQFLGYWARSPRGSDQYRCRSGDRWRCRGETEGRCKKKKVRLRIYPKIPLVHDRPFFEHNTKPKIEFTNKINSFSRHPIYRHRYTHINI